MVMLATNFRFEAIHATERKIKTFLGSRSRSRSRSRRLFRRFGGITWLATGPWKCIPRGCRYPVRKWNINSGRRRTRPIGREVPWVGALQSNSSSHTFKGYQLLKWKGLKMKVYNDVVPWCLFPPPIARAISAQPVMQKSNNNKSML